MNGLPGEAISDPNLITDVRLLEQRIGTAEKDHKELEGKIDTHLERIYKKLDRPSWLVLWVIGALMTVSGSMFTLILSKGLTK